MEQNSPHPFSQTLKEADNLLRAICCATPGCVETTGELFFIGSTCKHTFCRRCKDRMCGFASSTCPICYHPADVKHVKQCKGMMELISLVGDVKKAIAQLRVVDCDALVGALDMPSGERRTVDDFILSQDIIAITSSKMTPLKSSSMTQSHSLTAIKTPQALVLTEKSKITPSSTKVTPSSTKITPSSMKITPSATKVTPSSAKTNGASILFSQFTSEEEEREEEAIQLSQAIDFQAPDVLRHFPVPPVNTFGNRSAKKTSDVKNNEPKGNENVKNNGLKESEKVKNNGPKENGNVKNNMPKENENIPRPTRRNARSLGNNTAMVPVNSKKTKRSSDVMENKKNSVVLDESLIVVDPSAKRARRVSRGERNAKGESLLIRAVIRQDHQQIAALLQKPIDVNEQDNAGWTALHEAAARDDEATCTLLLEHGAAVDAAGMKCETPLHQAVINGSIRAVRCLLEWGADRTAVNAYGKTVFDLCAHRKPVIEAIRKCSTVDFKVAKNVRPRLCFLLSQRVRQSGRAFLLKFAAVTDKLEEATHFVVNVDPIDQAVHGSTRVYSAMAMGVMLIRAEWLELCIKENKFMEPDAERFSIRGICRVGHLIKNEDAAIRSYENKLKMRSPLFAGCQFFLCKHKYTEGRNVLINFIKLAGGEILDREPSMVSWNSNPTIPVHAIGDRRWSASSNPTGLFCVYVPGEAVPQKIEMEPRINLVTNNWIYESLTNFALAKTDSW